MLEHDNHNGDLSHLDERGRAHMVDIGDKPVTVRIARARAELKMHPTTLTRIQTGGMQKGDVLAIAQVAAIMAAKRTSDLIPLCHPIPLTGVDVSFTFVESERLAIDVVVRTQAQTGVEMEAMTAASVGALTVYDMCKSIDREMVIEFVALQEKSGGKSGQFVRIGSDS